jgi:peptidoglycan/LPS O-acetylase OafA/YrhL
MRPPADGSGTARLDQIDLLKAFAIVGVVFQHGVPFGDRTDVWASLWADQSVPIFVVLTGLLLAHSRGVGPLPWRGARAREYLRRRFARLLIPFGTIWVASLALGVLIGSVYFGPLTVLGALPVIGPGNYYVPVAIQLVLLAPAVAWACRRRPVETLFACFVINAGFEVAWAQIGPPHSGGSEFLYDSIALRYLFLLALGVWLTVGTQDTRRKMAWLLLGAGVAAVYLVLEHGRADLFLGLVPGFERRTNFLVAAYPALLVALGLRWLPARAPGALRPAVSVGKASYHVYLVQIVWFGAMPEQSLGRFAIALVAVVPIGLIFHRLVPGRPGPRLGRPRHTPQPVHSSHAEVSRRRSATW